MRADDPTESFTIVDRVQCRPPISPPTFELASTLIHALNIPPDATITNDEIPDTVTFSWAIEGGMTATVTVRAEPTI